MAVVAFVAAPAQAAVTTAVGRRARTGQPAATRQPARPEGSRRWSEHAARRPGASQQGAQAQRIHLLVTRFGFRQVLSPHAPARSLKRGAKACSAVKKAHPKRRCTVVARTLGGARRLAIKPQVDLVVVRRNQLPPLAQLKALRGSRGRVVVLVQIGRGRSLQTAAGALRSPRPRPATSSTSRSHLSAPTARRCSSSTSACSATRALLLLRHLRHRRHRRQRRRSPTSGLRGRWDVHPQRQPRGVQRRGELAGSFEAAYSAAASGDRWESRQAPTRRSSSPAAPWNSGQRYQDPHVQRRSRHDPPAATQACRT